MYIKYIEKVFDLYPYKIEIVYLSLLNVLFDWNTFNFCIDVKYTYKTDIKKYKIAKFEAYFERINIFELLKCRKTGKS